MAISDFSAINRLVLDDRELFVHIFNTSQIGITVSSLEHNWLEANDAFCMMLGYTREELFDLDLRDIIHPQDYETDTSLYQRILDGEIDNFSGNRRYLCKGGEILYTHLTVDSVRDVDGNIKFCIAFVRDVSSQNDTEQALIESESKYRTIVETTSEWIWEVDRKGRNTYSNSIVESFLGYSPEEIMGKVAFVFMEDSNREMVKQKFQESVRNKSGWRGLENRWRHKNGDRRILESNAIPMFDDNGELSGFRGSDRDITSRKKAEEALHKRALQHTVISEIGQQALQNRNITGLMDLIVRKLSDTLGVEYAKILAYSPETNDLLLHAGLGWNDGLIGNARVSAGPNSQAGYTLISNRPIIVEDLNTETRFSGPSLLLDHGVTSGMSVIIAGKDHPWGILGVHTREHRLFSRDDIEFLSVIANILADAIKRIRAENEVRQFKNIVDASDDIILFIDRSYRYQAVNREMLRLTHRERNEVIGHSADEILGVDFFNDNVKPYIDRCLAGETIHLRREFKSGEDDTMYLNMHFNPHREMDGTISGVVFIARNITGQKRAEEQIQIYQRIVDASNDMMIFIDTDYIYRAVNIKFLEIFQLTREEIIGRSVSDVFGKGFFESVKPSFDRCLAGENFYQLMWGMTPQVADIYMNIAYNPYRGQEGTMSGVVISIRDLTETWRTEEENRQYKDIVDSSEDMIAYIDNGYVFRVVNQPYLDLTGKPHHEVIGRKFEEVRGSDYFYNIAKGNIDRCLKGEAVYLQRWFDFPDNTRKYIDAILNPFRDGKGNIRGFVFSGRDITEQKNLEDALQISSGQLREAQRINRMGFWNIDLINDTHTWSDEVYDIFGVDRKTFKVDFGEIIKLVHPDDRDRIIRTNDTDDHEGDRINQEYRIIRPGTGELRHVQGIRKIIRDKHGMVTGRFGTVMDITDRKLTEDNIRYSRERLRNLASRLQAIREEEHTLIAREIHDELGQALTGLRLDLSWIKNKIPKRWKILPGRIGDMIKEIDNQIDYVRSLSSSLRPTLLDELGLGAAIEWQVQGFATRTGCRYTLDISHIELKENYELETAVFRIFQEALNNIARHAEADHIEISLPDPEKDLVLTIRDNGIGITQDQLSDPHSIGIIGMNERAGALGGTVRVQRLNEGGTQVTITMPYKDRINLS